MLNKFVKYNIIFFLGLINISILLKAFTYLDLNPFNLIVDFVPIVVFDLLLLWVYVKGKYIQKQNMYSLNNKTRILRYASFTLLFLLCIIAFTYSFIQKIEADHSMEAAVISETEARKITIMYKAKLDSCKSGKK